VNCCLSSCVMTILCRMCRPFIHIREDICDCLSLFVCRLRATILAFWRTYEFWLVRGESFAFIFARFLFVGTMVSLSSMLSDIPFQNSWKHPYDAVYVLRVWVVIIFESVVKCGVDMVTSGGELLIATKVLVGGRRKTKKHRKRAERRSPCYPISRLQFPLF